MIAHELQIIENLFDRGRSACFVVNEANAFATVCEYAGFIRSMRPDSLTVRCSSMLPATLDQCSHQTDQRVPTDWVQARRGVVFVEYVRASNRAANSRSHSAPANAPMLKLLEFLPRYVSGSASLRTK